MTWSRRLWLKAAAVAALLRPTKSTPAQSEPAQPFGAEFPQLDGLATGEWWTKPQPRGPQAPPPLDVPRDQVVAFALYTVSGNTRTDATDGGTPASSVLKLTAQLYPLQPGEPREARLEVQREGQWTELARTPVLYPGWSAHFRIENWDSTQNVPYRVRHGEAALFEGVIRRDPVEQDEIVVANMSCNSARTTGPRVEIVDALREINPDLLFFAGDQTYRHTEHTAGWIEFGLQFRELMRDRPTVSIPDDHDVGHPNLWGENGKRSQRKDGADGGYFFPAEYVNLVQRHQTWHLPDPVDPAAVEQGIAVYFTRLRVGGVDFAILEDRKFKSGPEGKIPPQGPRPDHINDPNYDPRTVDVAGLQLLGNRQLRFLREWTSDWSGAQMKAVLSQTAFCGACHLHGQPSNRLLADLDCNGWPQTGRRLALEEIRRAWAVHLCGDQHLAVVVQHGIDDFRDGPFAFTSPALVNTIYGRWWHPADEQPGPRPVPESPLPWTGDYRDGLGNAITMLAYANPVNVQDERQRADGFGIARFHKGRREITFECWPRFAPAEGPRTQFAGWPLTIAMAENDGRQPVGWLPAVVAPDGVRPVVQVLDEATGLPVYTVRAAESRFSPAVYAGGKYTVRAGRDRPDVVVCTGAEPQDQAVAGERAVSL